LAINRDFTQNPESNTSLSDTSRLAKDIRKIEFKRLRIDSSWLPVAGFLVPASSVEDSYAQQETTS
jgi:hypothetical protein